MSIRLAELQREDWERLVPQAQRFTLHQSWEYGEAKAHAQGWLPVRSVILDGSEPVGLVQALTRKWPVARGLVRIKRGPILFPQNGHPSEMNRLEPVLQALRRSWVEEQGYVLSIALEVEPGRGAEEVLAGLGFLSASRDVGWASAILDLSQDMTDLRRNLRGSWRRHLKRSEGLELELEQGRSSENLEYLLQKHHGFEESKGFKGPGDLLLRGLARRAAISGAAQVIYVRSKGERIGGLLLVGHGDSCTYLVGWNSDEGRRLLSSYYMFWSAFALAKSLGYRWFDLGGINERSAPGVANFKRRIGGQEYANVGGYLCARGRLATRALVKLTQLLPPGAFQS